MHTDRAQGMEAYGRQGCTPAVAYRSGEAELPELKTVPSWIDVLLVFKFCVGSEPDNLADGLAE